MLRRCNVLKILSRAGQSLFHPVKGDGDGEFFSKSNAGSFGVLCMLCRSRTDSRDTCVRPLRNRESSNDVSRPSYLLQPGNGSTDWSLCVGFLSRARIRPRAARPFSSEHLSPTGGGRSRYLCRQNSITESSGRRKKHLSFWARWECPTWKRHDSCSTSVRGPVFQWPNTTRVIGHIESRDSEQLSCASQVLFGGILNSKPLSLS